MEAAVLRDELHSYIDALPDRSLPALRPLLSFLVEPEPLVIEPADADEIAMIEASLAEHHGDMTSLTPWKKVRMA